MVNVAIHNSPLTAGKKAIPVLFFCTFNFSFAQDLIREIRSIRVLFIARIERRRAVT